MNAPGSPRDAARRSFGCGPELGNSPEALLLGELREPLGGTAGGVVRARRDAPTAPDGLALGGGAAAGRDGGGSRDATRRRWRTTGCRSTSSPGMWRSVITASKWRWSRRCCCAARSSFIGVQQNPRRLAHRAFHEVQDHETPVPGPLQPSFAGLLGCQAGRGAHRVLNLSGTTRVTSLKPLQEIHI
jgi:hypothetical protein